jgi:hypothetical protein
VLETVFLGIVVIICEKNLSIGIKQDWFCQLGLDLVL